MLSADRKSLSALWICLHHCHQGWHKIHLCEAVARTLSQHQQNPFHSGTTGYHIPVLHPFHIPVAHFLPEEEDSVLLLAEKGKCCRHGQSWDRQVSFLPPPRSAWRWAWQGTCRFLCLLTANPRFPVCHRRQWHHPPSRLPVWQKERLLPDDALSK